MPKNRDYTGLVRTPSSMAWLISQRARVKGQLDRLQQLQSTLPERIKTAQAELRALDAVIPLHKVKVEPQAIQGKRTYAPRLSDHGELTRFVLRKLREARGTPIFTTELAFQFVREHKVDLKAFPLSVVAERLRKRLKVLVNEGVVLRHHSRSTADLGSWSLINDDEDAADEERLRA